LKATRAQWEHINGISDSGIKDNGINDPVYRMGIFWKAARAWENVAAPLKRIRFTPIQILVHLSAWALAAFLTWEYFTGRLTINPIQAATQRLGIYALVFLTLTLANTPIGNVLGYRPILKARRAMGLYSFFFALAHFLMFVGVDYHFNLAMLLPDIIDKKYVWVGVPAFLILIALAITSTKGWMRRLGRNWKHLHRLVYAAGILVILHYAWAKKGNLFSLRGDIQQPLLFGLLISILLLLRLPAIRKWATSVRDRFR
jgi:sulfoxide reductase heme-binding subunit YedZ